MTIKLVAYFRFCWGPLTPLWESQGGFEKFIGYDRIFVIQDILSEKIRTLIIEKDKHIEKLFQIEINMEDMRK